MTDLLIILIGIVLINIGFFKVRAHVWSPHDWRVVVFLGAACALLGIGLLLFA